MRKSRLTPGSNRANVATRKKEMSFSAYCERRHSLATAHLADNELKDLKLTI
jgi:hypothetical protein